MKHSERETRALRQIVKEGERERRDLVAQNRAMASRQQELQKAEFARHTQEMQHQAAVAQAKLRGVLAHVAALERENSQLRCSITFAPAVDADVLEAMAQAEREAETARLLAEEDARRQAQEVAAAEFVATQVEAATVTPPAPPSEHPPPQKFSNDGSFLEQIKRQLAAASRIQTAWRNRADAPTPPGEPVNDLRLALEAHSELKAHEARSSATRKPLRPRN